MGFQFKDRHHTLDILGKSYTVLINAELGDYMTKVAAEMSRVSKAKKDTGEKGDEFIAICERTIDRILGDGAFAEIFSERDPNVDDCGDVMTYITDEIKAKTAALKE